MPLLRVSDFCRQFPYVDEDGYGDDDGGDDEDDDTDDISVDDGAGRRRRHKDAGLPVSVSLWSSSARPDDDDGNCSGAGARGGTAAAPSGASSALVPLSVLASLSLQDGGLAFLFCSQPRNEDDDANDDDDDDDGRRGRGKKGHGTLSSTRRRTRTRRRAVALRLRLMEEPPPGTGRQPPGPTIQMPPGVVEEEEGGRCCGRAPPAMIFVPPVVVTNLGITPHEILDGLLCDCGTDLACQGRGSRRNFWLRAVHDEASTVLVAGRVVLRPLGRRPLWPFLSAATQPNGNSHRSNNNNDGKDDGDTDAERRWIFPSPHRFLLQPSMLCAVPVPSDGGRGGRRRPPNNVGGSAGGAGCPPDEVCYYEVVRIEEEGTAAAAPSGDAGPECRETRLAAAAGPPSQQHRRCVYETAAGTAFELDSDPIDWFGVRRLPPLDLQSSYFFGGDSSDSNKDGDSESPSTIAGSRAMIVPPHPNWKQVARALIYPGVEASPSTVASDTAATLCSTRVVHLIGTDADHHVRRCVEAAAHQVGLQCLSVRGLAAFAHDRGRPVRGNALADQLAGMEAAFRYVRQSRMEPCVLHLHDVDGELSPLDDQLRREQEDRLWAKWMEGIEGSRKSHRPDATDQVRKGGGAFDYTPPILIVISTSEELKPGPWREKLVFPSIPLSTPDDAYIRYLWETSSHDAKGTAAPAGNWREGYLPLLKGRTAKEVVQLRYQMAASAYGSLQSEPSSGSSSAPVAQLERLCHEMDATRRTASSNLAQISNVRWEDVGGLDHVRREVMDAIELPLKYPHLFPPNTGRSGILLFGPPGTGKTLVAKAVATEIGLPFLSIKGPELLGSYVGESEANVRKAFASAREAAANNHPIPAAVLFFDELDSLAPRRGGVDHGGGVMERVVASLLAELDGPPAGGGGSGNGGGGRVFVLGATNRPDLLDPSLLRPGRLDRLVYLGIPTSHDERSRVLASQLRKMRLEGDAMEMAGAVVSTLPPRLTGADLSKLSSGAMLHAVHRLCRQADEERNAAQKSTTGATVSMDDILEAWGDARCTPTVTMDDLWEASKEVAPSVSEAELDRYERLRDEHCTKK